MALNLSATWPFHALSFNVGDARFPEDHRRLYLWDSQGVHLEHRGNHGHMPTLTKEIIEAAIAGFEGQKQKIDDQIAELRGMLNGDGSDSATEPTSGTRRKFSPAAIKRMREAQQRRWAKVRGESAPATPINKSLKPKRTMSAAGRKAIADAQKKRWAAKKAA